ncbi:hypothetical protein N9X54_09040 [Planktomarina temperata]|jgi:hypothetical protein|nr:hypothetical protein [Planktomarina temperata]MDA9115161.1 hypothetical protein [Planktomarina temperata]MDB2520331.1 hypothetical protein [Planktomarina temperata]MDC3265366.1 hypothetical protein [Planktomarina temperata]
MSGITEIQKALNIIRAVERESTVDARLATLALVSATAADIARELRGGELTKSKPKTKAIAQIPIPKPATPTPQQQQDIVNKPPKLFTEPELPAE